MTVTAKNCAQSTTRARQPAWATLWLLALPDVAAATGLTGGLEGLLAAYVTIWAVAGIVPAAMLLGTFSVARDAGGRRKPLAWFLALPAILYIPTAIPWVFVPDAYVAGKICAIVGFVLLHGVIAWAIDRKQVRRSLHVIIGVVFAALVVTPTSFWERPLVAFGDIEFNDNLVGLDAEGLYWQSGHSDHWLALDDGRRLFVLDSTSGPIVVAGSHIYGNQVALAPMQSEDGQPRVALTYYEWTDAYRKDTIEPRPRFVIGGTKATEPMYQATHRAVGVLLSRDTPIDYIAELVTALRLSTRWLPEPEDEGTRVWQSWVRTFIELGDIDINSSAFLDRAFATDRYYSLVTLLELGMEPTTVDSRGNTALHIAARNESSVFRQLLALGAIPDLQNEAGRTALDEGRLRYGRTPQAWRVADMERAVADALLP